MALHMKWRRVGSPRMIFYLALVMIAAEVIMHGVRPTNFQRAWQNILARPNQSLALRFLLQPAISNDTRHPRRHKGRAHRTPALLRDGNV